VSEESEFAMELVEDEAESESEPVDRDELGKNVRLSVSWRSKQAGIPSSLLSGAFFVGFAYFNCSLAFFRFQDLIRGSGSTKSPSAVRMDRANS